jgi:signal transduction histidine kinase/ligand-binding sensor domain-containing protein
MARRLFFLSLVCCALCFQTASSVEYRIDGWTTENGLPQNSVNSLAQTRDGYLWLATNDGLARFDGVRFVVFNKSNTEAIANNRIGELYEDGNGRLWVGVEDGSLLFYENGKFTVAVEPNDARFNPRGFLTDDGAGGIFFWVEREPGKYLHYTSDADGKLHEREFPDLPPGAGVRYRDRDGGVWFVGATNFHRLKNGEWQTFNFSGSNNTKAVYQDRAGNFWLTADFAEKHIYRIRKNRLEKIETPVNRVWHFSEDTAGNLWLTAYERGVLRLAAGRVNADALTAADFELYTAAADGILSDKAAMITPDREGGIWVATEKGLNRLSPQTVRVFSKKDGLREDNIYPILEDRTGAIWLGAWQQSLIRYEAGVFKTFPHTNEAAYYSSLFEDRSGTIWLGTIAEVFRLENDNLVKYTSRAGFASGATFHVIAQDRDGAMWFGTSKGLSRVREDGGAEVFTVADGLPDNFVTAFLQSKDGKIWVGTRGGVAVLECGMRNAECGIVKYVERDGLASNYTRSLYEDADGAIWIGSYDGGLTRYKDGRLTRYTTGDGLHSSGAFCILEDANGWFWMNSNQGIYRVRRQELNDFADGKTKFLTSIAYTKQDGLLNIEGNGGRQPAGIKTRNGKLWFPTAQGAAVIDPETVTTNPLPPPVLIEEVSIDRQRIGGEKYQSAVRNPQSAIEMEPNQNNIEIQYTGLSFINSGQVKFRYKLEGLDEDWVEAANRRTAYYSYLPAGEYTFKVIAANRDGVWNMTGAQMRVVVHPAFYQTWWFIALCALAIALIVRLIYSYRFAQLKKINEARTAFTQQLIENQEAERKRIAVELHDSIGQSLIVIRNRALMSLNQPEKPQRVLEQMQEISESAADSIKEVREIAHNLHPYQLEHLGLTTALETMIEAVEAATEIEFALRIDDVDDTLSKDAEINLYRVVQECLNNIVKHSNATAAKISLIRNNGFLNLSVEDDGKGFDVGAAKDKRGLGLTGIGERAKMLNAEYEINSLEGKGTTINLLVNLENK